MMRVRVQTSFGKGKCRSVSIKIRQRFATAIIDPDWPYTVAPGVASIDQAKGNGRLSGYTRNRDKSRNQYKQRKPLTIEQLKTLPIGELVGGYLFLWVVGPFLINGAALDVMKAWGFEPSSIITWAKYNRGKKRGYGGVGFWFLGNAEFCIVGKRKGWPSIRTGWLIVEKKLEHSRKPDNIHELCEQRFPGPYLEIFGRRPRKGWTVIGNEAPGGDGKDIRRMLFASPLPAPVPVEASGFHASMYQKRFPALRCVNCRRVFLAARKDAKTCSAVCRTTLWRKRKHRSRPPLSEAR
jgi:N6-adenosine-specific RNA methylase IME4